MQNSVNLFKPYNKVRKKGLSFKQQFTLCIEIDVIVVLVVKSL